MTAMTGEERQVLEAVQFNWAVSPEDVWSPIAHHVESLHADAARTVMAGFGAAERSTGASPIGFVLEGEKGVGKTHMVRWVRQEAQRRGGYFFLVKFLEGTPFWRSALHGVVQGFHEGQGDQLTPLLTALAERTGRDAEQSSRLVGRIPVRREHLDDFIAALRGVDRLVWSECQDTLRALVLYAASDAAAQEVGQAYLTLDDALEDTDRAAWGFRRGSRTAQEKVRDLSWLLALTGPSVIAVDQIDTLMVQSAAGTAHAVHDRRSTLVNQVADGLMQLREHTRRTLTVVACIPATWELVRNRAISTASDRFRTVTLQSAMPDVDVPVELVERHLRLLYATVGFTPPHPTWPVSPSASADGAARNFTPRRLLQRVDAHIRHCLETGVLHEMQRLDEETSSTGRTRRIADAELTTFDARFAELRADADVRLAVDAAHEDERMPELLAAGLSCFIAELGDRGQRFFLDPRPGAKPALHARLRCTLDESTDDEVHWGFRGIAAGNARAALTRLRRAMTESGLSPGIDKRKLVVLRDHPFSAGPKTTEAIEEFAAGGGEALLITADDLRTFAALEAMQRPQRPGFLEWLAVRRPAGSTELFRRVLRELPEPPVPAGGVRPVADTGASGSGSPERDDADPGAAGPVVPLGDHVDGPGRFAVPLELLRKHTAVFAGSGSGKTVLLRRLVEECALQGVSAIVLDPNNDLARLGDAWPSPPPGWRDGDAAKADEYLTGTEVVVWTPRRERGRPLAFRPLPRFADVLDDPDEFGSAVDAAVLSLMPRAQLVGQKIARGKAVLNEALVHYARNGGDDLPGLIELLSDLAEGVSSLNNADRLAADIAEALKAARVNDPLFGGDGEALDPGVLLTPPRGFRARISVISFIGLPDDEQRQSFVNQLQMALFSWIKKNPANDRPLGALMVMDEAQTFAPSGAMTPCTQSTLTLAAQARKYGLGLVFATQAPKGLHNRIPGNAANQFFGFLNSPAQINAASEIAAQKGGRVDDFARLSAGTFYGASVGENLRKVRVPMCLSHHPSSALTTEEVLERARAHARPGPTGAPGTGRPRPSPRYVTSSSSPDR
jgi:hypothetical protein